MVEDTCLRRRMMNYKEFRVKEVFEVENSRPLHKVNLLPSEGEGIPYITRTKFSNGFEETIVNVQGGFKNPKNTITFGAESVQFFYQPFEYFTGNKMYYLTRKDGEEITENQGLYLTTIIQSSLKNTGYGYGMGLTGTRFKERKIMLPIDDTGHPNWTFMEEYVQIKSNQIKDTYQLPRQHEITDFRNLDEVEWDEYLISDFFDVNKEKGNESNMDALLPGNIPLISAKKINNGLKDFVTTLPRKIKSSNVITWNKDGDGGAGLAYYQEFKFAVDSHVFVLYAKFPANKYNQLFIVTLLSKYKEIFNHGRANSLSRFKVEKIKLPTKDNQPDFVFMEQYMKRMENKVIQKTEMN